MRADLPGVQPVRWSRQENPGRDLRERSAARYRLLQVPKVPPRFAQTSKNASSSIYDLFMTGQGRPIEGPVAQRHDASPDFRLTGACLIEAAWPWTWRSAQRSVRLRQAVSRADEMLACTRC